MVVRYIVFSWFFNVSDVWLVLPKISYENTTNITSVDREREREREGERERERENEGDAKLASHGSLPGPATPKSSSRRRRITVTYQANLAPSHLTFAKTTRNFNMSCFPSDFLI